MNKGLLIVVSGPSGCGKGTILAEVLKKDNFFYSVSATTRKARPGEIDGINYHFISKDKFEELIKSNGMLEYACYCDNYYGTPKDKVEEMLDAGKDVILEIEVIGAMKIKQQCPDALFIFILPPSLKELKKRLTDRGTESADIVDQRINQAEREIKEAYQYDYAIVNDKLDYAVDDLVSVIKAEKMKKNKKNKIDEVLNNA